MNKFLKLPVHVLFLFFSKVLDQCFIIMIGAKNIQTTLFSSWSKSCQYYYYSTKNRPTTTTFDKQPLSSIQLKKQVGIVHESIYFLKKKKEEEIYSPSSAATTIVKSKKPANNKKISTTKETITIEPKWKTKKWFALDEDDTEFTNNQQQLQQQGDQYIEEYENDQEGEEEEEVTSQILEEPVKGEEMISNVWIGTEFEKLVIEQLSQFGFKLNRVGGAGDKGIDLNGVWEFGETTFNVIVQCKKLKKKVGPSVLREMESTLSRFIEKSGTTGNKSIGLIASYSQFTDNVQMEIDSFQPPIIICQIYEQGLLSFMMNRSARHLLPKLTIAKRYNTSLPVNNNNNNNNVNNKKLTTYPSFHIELMINKS
ncbi:hypothetical protein DFA_03354 [Cavenderia fasciculata]|uniref:Restriction endonuclease type IV Mrr domain-containing protein n=1 Tax=Cavenderia fasciculata TaxID=261658 RepID=F4PHC4_CACFS|nr:uncharacterized protein DFA_03354 [Cavenderia fasciculata]EGG25108.1 hypothetical protein DFA_03354 [Cavenderia fasciculata]|eukprot:XP_004362959.1 hypothetical protein DFA_03354 [Cavenderia fasciculata]